MYCDICKTDEHISKYRRKDGVEMHLCRLCARMFADMVDGKCSICRHAHRSGDTLYCMIGNNMKPRQEDQRCGRFYPVPCRKCIK